MTIQQRIKDEESESEHRLVVQKGVDAFFEKFDLSANEREDSLQYISNLLLDREDVITSVIYNSPLKGGEWDVRVGVTNFLQDFIEQMDEIVTELNRLSKQAKEERERIAPTKNREKRPRAGLD
jgi:hypothetical protein